MIIFLEVTFSLKCAIFDRSTEGSRPRNTRGEAQAFIAVPRDLLGFVIGKRGSSVKEIEMESGAKLSADSDQGGFLVSGNTEQRTRARELVDQKVVSLTKRATLEGSFTATILIGFKNVEFVAEIRYFRTPKPFQAELFKVAPRYVVLPVTLLRGLIV